jgi:hypothetical protein
MTFRPQDLPEHFTLDVGETELQRYKGTAIKYASVNINSSYGCSSFSSSGSQDVLIMSPISKNESKMELLDKLVIGVRAERTPN